MSQCWQIDNGPVKACTAAFNWFNTGTKRQRSKYVKSRSKVHQLMCISIRMHNMCQVTHFPYAIASIDAFDCACAIFNCAMKCVNWRNCVVKCVTWRILCSHMLIRINWCTLLRDLTHFDFCRLVPVLNQLNVAVHALYWPVINLPVCPLLAHYWPITVISVRYRRTSDTDVHYNAD